MQCLLPWHNMTGVLDQSGRPLQDLRISVTDRCNMRCDYCMPAEIFDSKHQFMHRNELLTFEEINSVIEALVPIGLKKIRLTGGEPLLRRNLENLIQMISKHPVEIAMTTNGLLFAGRGESLRKSGLDRVTFSLDSLDPQVFERITNTSGEKIEVILRSIDEAVDCGLGQVRINSVIRRGINELDIDRLVDQFEHLPVSLRFIEFMDVGNHNRWRHNDVVPSSEIQNHLKKRMNLIPIDSTYRGEVAQRWTVEGKNGFEIGFISSVSQPFCGDCTRARISSDGHLYTCLFASAGTNLKSILRNESEENSLQKVISEIWKLRDDRYSELRSKTKKPGTIILPKIEMSYIGG